MEFEGQARFARDFAGAGSSLNLNATLGYIDGEYKNYEVNGVDISDVRRIQNTPKWTASAGLGALVPAGSGLVNANIGWSYRSKTNQFETPSPYLDQKGYGLWDADLVWTSDDDRYSIGLHAKNIFDKQYITSGYQFLQVGTDGTPVLAGGNPVPTLGLEGIATAFYGNPRQVSVSLGVKF